MNTVDILTKARSLIEDPKHWTKGQLRKVNEDGSMCYCALGAVDQALREVGYGGGVAVIRTLGAVVPKLRPIGRFNDDPWTEHADVLKVYDKAIDYAKSGPVG